MMFFLISLIIRTFYIISVPLLLHRVPIVVHRGVDMLLLRRHIDQAHVLAHIHTIADTPLDDLVVTGIIDADEVVQVATATNPTVEHITDTTMMLRSLKVLFTYTTGFVVGTMLNLCN